MRGLFRSIILGISIRNAVDYAQLIRNWYLSLLLRKGTSTPVRDALNYKIKSHI